MITQEQIQRVHALVDKWGISDPIKQHTKMGEEIGEYLDSAYIDEIEKEIGDVYFTLIALSYQCKIDFYIQYELSLTDYVELNTIDLVKAHLNFGGDLLKYGIKCDSEDYVQMISRILKAICNLHQIDESKALESVLIKNENKTGKTVNGTFIKTQDL